MNEEKGEKKMVVSLFGLLDRFSITFVLTRTHEIDSKMTQLFGENLFRFLWINLLTT